MFGRNFDLFLTKIDTIRQAPVYKIVPEQEALRKKSKKIKALYIVVLIFHYHILLYFFFTKESSFVRILQNLSLCVKKIHEIKKIRNIRFQIIPRQGRP
jgi:hypothetical protein